MAGSAPKVNKLAMSVLAVLAAVNAVLGVLHEPLGISADILGAVATISTLIAGFLRPLASGKDPADDLKP